MRSDHKATETVALKRYRESTTKLLNVLILPHQFAVQLDEITKVVTKIVRSSGIDHNIDLEYIETNLAMKKYVQDAKILPGMFYTKMVDQFLIYVQDILKIIHQSRPDLLRVEAKISYSEIVEFRKISDLTDYLIESLVHSLSFSGAYKLGEEVSKRTGIRLWRSSTIAKRITKIVEIRNLLVHNNGICNYRFNKRTGLNEPIGKVFKKYREMSTLFFLDKLSVDIDNRVRSQIRIRRKHLVIAKSERNDG